MKLLNRIPFVLSGLAALLVLTTWPAYSAQPIRIGATVSLNGRYQATSEMIRNAYRLWETQVNSRGGLLHRPVELLLVDDHSQPDEARAGYVNLIERAKVDLVLAPYGTPLTLAVAEITERHGFTLLASAASGAALWEQGHKRVFGVYATADRYFIGFLDLIARNGFDTVAILAAEGSFTMAAADGARQWAGRFGLVTSQFESFTNPEQIESLLVKFGPMTAEALIVCAYPPADHRVLDLLGKRGIRPAAVGMTIAPALPDFASKAGKQAQGVFGPSQWEPDERLPFPGTKPFIKDFEAAYGVSPSYHAGAAFAGCQLLEDAVSQVGAIDHQKIGQYIRSLDTVTVIGRFKVDKDGRQIGHNPILIQWQNGKKQIVYPFKMKTANPTLNRAAPR